MKELEITIKNIKQLCKFKEKILLKCLRKKEMKAIPPWEEFKPKQTTKSKKIACNKLKRLFSYQLQINLNTLK